MRKLFLASFFFMGVSLAYAQESKFGFIVGFNLSTIGGDSEGVRPKVGYQFGVMSLLALNDEFSIQPELVFSNQGTHSKSDPKIRFNYGYINFPLLLRYQKKDLSFVIGPQLGVLINTKIVNKLANDKQTIIGQLNNLDVSISLGFEYDINIQMGVSTRLNLGLTNASANSNFEGDFLNRSLQLSYYYFFKSKSE